MKKVVILVIAIFLCFMACKKREKPKDLIPKEKMEAILYDLYIISAAKGVNKKLLEENGLNPNQYILEKYQIDSLQFATSNNYYTYTPKEYLVMIDSVKARLEKEKKVYEKIRKEEDSLKKQKKDLDQLDQEIIDEADMEALYVQ